MKVLFNKLKKSNKVFLSIYLIASVLYIISYILLFKNLISLTSIETFIRIIILVILGIWFIVYGIWNLVNLILKRHITIAISTSVTVIISIVSLVISYYIGMVSSSIDNLAENKYVTYTTNLVVLNSTNIDKDSTLGMINNSDDIEGNILAKELIKKEKLNDDNVVEYSSYYEMIYDLLNGDVEGIFLTSNYLTIFSNEEFEGLENTKVAYSFSKEMKNKDTSIISNKSLTDPFTVLLMGVDSEVNGLKSNTTFNGDTLMLITFNPKTLNATMFSIPRDTYVPIACNNNNYAKINSSAAYGTSCVIKTVEQLTDVKIDYYVKINFKGVVDLVEALGGIEVDVEAPDYNAYIKAYKGRVCEQNSLRQFGDKLVCIDPGVQKLNGEEALAYARCRHAYLASDLARNKHQQQIIEAIARKAANKKNIGKLQNILDAVTNNLDTNMARSQILSFYEVLKNMIAKTLNDGEFLTLEKTYLEVYNLPVRIGNNGMMLSALGYYPGSLEAIVNLMKANLGLEKKEMIKTFSFDANEEYQPTVTGQGITTGERLVTMQNFVGLTISQAEEWANNNGIELEIEYVDNTSSYYNPNILPGMIANQSVSNGVLINNIDKLIIYVNEASYDIPNSDTQEKDEIDDDIDNSKDTDKNKDINDEIDIPDVIFPMDIN